MYRKELDYLKKVIFKKLQEIEKRNLKIDRKDDRSLVTELDFFISSEVKELFTKRHPDFNFYSEEDPENFNFPVIVLDPLDGTREFVKGYGECSVSLAILYSYDVEDPRNYGWIYNPFTGFEISSEILAPISLRKNIPNTLHIMVSRSEWDKKLIHYKTGKDICITPMGSIALKLGLLAGGACDIVISKRPKNIWDIAAGVIICHRRGIQSYSEDNEILKLDKKLYQCDFIWGRPREIQIVSNKI